MDDLTVLHSLPDHEIMKTEELLSQRTVMDERIDHNEIDNMFTAAVYLEAKAPRLVSQFNACKYLGQDNACFHNYPSVPLLRTIAVRISYKHEPTSKVDNKIHGGVCDNRNRDLIVLQPSRL
jgi:hypothetical protein